MTNKKEAIDKLMPEIIDLHKRGKTNPEIAGILGLSRTTVARRLSRYGLGKDKNHHVCVNRGKLLGRDAISSNDVMRIRNQIKVGQLIMCEVEVADKNSYGTHGAVKVLKNMYVVKKMLNGRGVLVSNNPDDTLGRLVTYVDIIQLRRRLKG